MAYLDELLKELVNEFIHEKLPECIEKNAHREDPYWILVILKPSLEEIEGKRVMKRVIRIFDIPPPYISGGMVLKVDNKSKAVTLEQARQAPSPFDNIKNKEKVNIG